MRGRCTNVTLKEECLMSNDANVSLYIHSSELGSCIFSLR